MATKKSKMKTNRKKTLAQWIMDSTRRVNIELTRLYGEEVEELYWETSFDVGNNKMLVETPVKFSELIELVKEEYETDFYVIMYDAVKHLIETVVKTSPDRLLMTRMAYTHQYTLEDVMVGEVYDKVGIRVDMDKIIRQSNIEVTDIDEITNRDVVVMMNPVFLLPKGMY